MSVISAQERLRVTENILRHGNEFDMLEVTRPKGMLEYLVNMFTLGGVRKEKEELYNCVIKNLRNCFHEHNITLNNLQDVKAINIFSKGMHIKFEPNARPEETRIIVKKGCEEESKLVPDHYFTSLCTSILLRDRLKLSHENDLLMPSGEINLTDIDETPLDLTEVISVLSNVPPQIKWTLSQEYIDNLNIVLRYSEFLEKNNNTKPFVSSEPEPQVSITPKTSTHNDTSRPVISWETTGADSDVATGYMNGTNSDSDTLSYSSTLEGDAESYSPLYHNMRNHKDLSVKVS